MASRNVETFAAAHKAFNRRDFDAVTSILADGFSYQDVPRGVTFRGRDEFRKWMQEWVSAFSNAEVYEVKYTDAGDTVVSEFTARGKNDGQFGPFPASGKNVSFGFCEIFTFDKNGKVTGGRAYYDQLSVLIQLGHVQPPSV